MNLKIKAKLLSSLIFFVLFSGIYLLLNYFITTINKAYIAGIAGALTAVLAPQIKSIKTQSANQFQMKWIFSKKINNGLF